MADGGTGGDGGGGVVKGDAGKGGRLAAVPASEEECTSCAADGEAGCGG